MNENNFIDSFRLVHVIGLVGAGKSTFIRQYLYEYPAFDIQIIYAQFNANPNEIFQNQDTFHQFQDTLRYSLNAFVNEAKSNHCPIIVIESSGINDQLNGLLEEYGSYRLWIDPGHPLEYDEIFLEEHPYAIDFNTHILELWKNGEIEYDNQFNLETLSFMKDLPSDLQEVFRIISKGKRSIKTAADIVKPDLSSKKSNANQTKQFQEYFKDNRYFCPKCNASFSKAEYLLKHFERYPACSPK